MLFCIYVALVAPAMELIRSRSWVECPATVTRSTIEKRRVTSKDSNGHNRSYWAYYPDIEVKYSWEGITYRCRRYDFRPPNGVSSQEGFEALNALLEKYPLGKKTTCFVNPEFPQESVMIRQWWQPILSLFAAIFGGTIIFSFCMIFISVRCLIRGPSESAAPDVAPDEEEPVEKDSYHNNYADDDGWK